MPSTSLPRFLKMQAIKDSNVDFAVKGGGHATNPGFSSTRGIQISMSRFNKLAHVSNGETGELTVGAGCVFDEIYKFVRPMGYNVVGGGGSVGIGGWMTGGGFSLKTNQYGLGIDNLLQARVVLPNGSTVLTASASSNTELFWAIKGGGNNFGIVTEFVLRSHKQRGNGNVYGGLLTYDKARIERVKKAIIEFIDKKDPKATIVAAFRVYRNHGVQEYKFTVLAFYDDEFIFQQTNPFEKFLAIPHEGRLANSAYTTLDTAKSLLYNHISTKSTITLLKEDDYHLMSFPSAHIAGLSIMNGRARWGNVMVSKYTKNLIDVVQEEAEAARSLMDKYNGKMIVTDVWPFLSGMFDNSVDSAWPHKRGEPNGPLLLYFLWEGEENDKVWVDQMKTALGHISRIALAEGCTTATTPQYGNTSLNMDTPDQLTQIYGTANLQRLRVLRRRYDEFNVMGRTGGFRIPLAMGFEEYQ
ncbi:hypothetical protein BDP27DRAFT_1423219 [Rhodocollybia butyracea]|uniref:FAD-binding PCMH-type domain-containing protein n=1 Tax=Rhodocollybia butyracea TaxID=206335 RepID=A0A9P5U5J9_9AGAR|nr:hypothetical protein BDP27DRAFT_1423219 [Rhodocollybia butyracea]